MKQAELQRTENKTTIQYNTTSNICNHKRKWKHRKLRSTQTYQKKTYYASCWQILLKIPNFCENASNLTIYDINPPQSEAPFQSLSMIRRSNTKALQYKRQIECNRITNDNQNINKTNEKHVKNYWSSRTPEDGRSLRSSITLCTEQLNIRFLLYESVNETPK